MQVPDHVRNLQKKVGSDAGVEFTFVKGKWNHLGEATLMNRIKSHPDVGARWYPDLLQQIRTEETSAAA
jgi:hypothetical protein